MQSCVPEPYITIQFSGVLNLPALVTDWLYLPEASRRVRRNSDKISTYLADREGRTPTLRSPPYRETWYHSSPRPALEAVGHQGCEDEVY